VSVSLSECVFVFMCVFVYGCMCVCFHTIKACTGDEVKLYAFFT
jgi:hypothetical protein